MASQLLGGIADRRVVAALRDAMEHSVPEVRRAAVASLGHSGSPEDVHALGDRLEDVDALVRSRARAALAGIGGSDAADVLFASLPGLNVEERSDAHAALAWLDDRRDYDLIRELAHKRITEPYGQGIEFAYRGWGSVYALGRVGTEEDRAALGEALLGLVRDAVVDDRQRWWIKLTAPVQGAVDAVVPKLQVRGLAERIAEEIELRRPSVPPTTRRDFVAVDAEPLLERSVPRQGMRELTVQSPPEAGSPPAKFGGQPDWIAEPMWPLSPVGHPMVFYGQLPLGGRKRRVAYVFFSPDVDETWEPLSAGNALVVQPGAPPQVDTRPMKTGPMLFETIHHQDLYVRYSSHRPYERYVALEPGADPAQWTWPQLPEGAYIADKHQDWNKIRGVPRFLQGEDWPEGDGWEFAFQFTAGRAGHEFADGAECYGFVNQDGRGAFLWQCH